ncbi:MAG: hypothetical protein WCG83_02930 [Candidatus Peregrinibacteria bacterium]
MLSLFRLVRHALSDSPTRERREVWFAKPIPKDDAIPDFQKNDGVELPEQLESVRPVMRSGEIQDEKIADIGVETKSGVEGVLRTLDTQAIIETLQPNLKNAEAFQNMLTREETLSELDIESVAKSLGIMNKFRVAQINVTTDPQQDPIEYKRELLEKIFQYDQIGGLTAGERYRFTEELIRRYPEAALALGRSVMARLDRYQEQEQILENRKNDFGGEMIREAEKILTLATPQQIANKQWEAPSIERSTAELENEIQNLPRRIERYLVKLGKRPAGTPSVRSILREALSSTVNALSETKEFGAKYWETDKGILWENTVHFTSFAQRKEYLENLRLQNQKLQDIAALQLQEQADAERKQLGKEIESAQKRATAAGTPLDDDTISRTAGDLDRAFAHAFDDACKLRTKVPLDITDPKFQEKSDLRQRRAERALQKIRRNREELDQTLALWEKRPLEEIQSEQQNRRSSATRCLSMIADLLSVPPTGVIGVEELKLLQRQMGDPAVVASWSENELATHERRLQFLCEVDDSEEKIRRIIADGTALQAKVETEIGKSPDDVSAWIRARTNEFDALERDFMGPPDNPKAGLLAHPICAEFDIVDLTREYIGDLRSQLKQYGNPKMKEQTRIELCTAVGVKCKQLQKARDLLKELNRATNKSTIQTGSDSLVILSPEAYIRKFEVKNSKGCYYRGKIYMRSDLDPDERISLIRHEKGHFILSILADQSHLFPDLVDRKMQEIPEAGMEEIMKQGERWGLPIEEFRKRILKKNPKASPGLIMGKYRRALAEEALVRKSFSRDPQSKIQDKDVEVFDAMEPGSEESDVAMHMTADDDEPMTSAPLETGTTEKTEAPYDPGEDLEAIELMIKQIDSFGDVYPQYRKVTREILDDPDGYRPWMKCVKDLYNNGSAQSPEGKTLHAEDPQHNRSFKNLIRAFKGHVSKKHKEIKQLDWKLSDVNDAQPVKKGKWYSDKLGIKWLSVLDMMRVWKEFQEDIKGMYTTMQDQRTSEFKEKLFERLPSKIFGVKIPIIGNYTERLPHYAERKRNSLELERVKKWEDSFTNLDSESLMELIGANPTKDQLRASIQLLEKKGRLNWADQRLWKALNKFSQYKMPMGPCERNEIIRDKWLQKLITDIWKDKEMFDEWKTGNDGAVKKHKSAYTATADNYSNITGQAEHELRGMLEQYVHSRKHEPPLPLPEEVNPHHYEEILHYSMRNGKMTMEGKFYYLIRGVAEGFIPIERLKVLAGQEGDVLIKFPFLDYFYRRHNTMKEIKHIANLITEKTGEEDDFNPGVKMTIFIRHTILRDSKARERMSKAIARSSETLDHEDVPYICSDIDWIRMKSLAGVVSGERSKLTHEGAKNAYVGFNEKLKLYAYKAMMEERGEAKFTDADVRDMAETLTSYVVFDNQMMRASMVGESKVNLSEAHLDEAPVMEANYKTRDFRDRTRDFVGDLARDVGLNDSDLKISGLSLSTFLASERRDEDGVVEEEAKKKVVRATEFFAKSFVRKICNNADTLKKLLIQREKSKPFLDACGGISFEEYRKDYLLLNADKK